MFRKASSAAAGLIGLLTIVLCVRPVGAQTFYGSIVGTVTDSSGAVVPGANVTITDLATNGSRKALTDSSGNYSFVSLLPATYRVEVAGTSFKRFERQPIQVTVDTTVRVDATLQVGSTSETIEVNTQPPLLQTESGSLGETIEANQVEAMPLNGRNTFNLMTLVPGVVGEGNSTGAAQMNKGTSTSSGGWGNYAIGGGLPLESAVYIDGAPVNTEQKNFTVLIPVQDTVQEFKVETSAVSPEFGRFGGGIVNMSTKSGSNQFHGGVYEYLRNNVLNANYFFTKRAGQSRPQWTQNQYGGTIGGPILKNKLFFFFAWEAIHIRTGAPTLTNIPTPQMQKGIIPEVYSSAGTLINSSVKDPRGNCNITHQPGTPSAPGTWTITNLFIGACGDPTAKILATFYPSTPNNPSNALDNWYKTVSEGDDGTQTTARIDYELSSKQRMFGKFVYWPMIDLAPVVVDQVNGWNTAGFQSHNHTYQYVFGDTYTLNPTTVLDIRADYLRNYGDAIPPSFNKANESQFGSAWAAMAPYMSYNAYPYFTFNSGTEAHNLYTFGYNNQSMQWYNNYHLAGSLTKIIGRHTLKMGAGFLQLQRIDHGADTSPSGSFAFSADLAGDEWANFLMGYFDSGLITTVKGTFAYSNYSGYYLTDTWQATPKLTLNLGLRYELPGAIADRHNDAAVLLPAATDPTTGALGTVALVASPQYARKTTLVPIHNAIGPRLGFAYRITNDTVIRGGYALSYLSDDLQIGPYPYQAPINSQKTTNTNSGSTINYVLSNPFPPTPQYPNGFAPVPGRSVPNFTLAYVGQSVSAPYPYQPYPEDQEMNLSLGQQLKGDLLLDLGFAHTLGTHLPSISSGLDQLPDQYDICGTDSTQPQCHGHLLTDPASPSISYGPVVLPKTYNTYGQTLRPFPAYSNVADAASSQATSSYNALELKVQKRFRGAGEISGSYAWSKTLGTAESVQASIQEAQASVPGLVGEGNLQDYTNPRAERSLNSYNVAHRLVVNYILNLPFGHGQYFANHIGGPADKVVSGWSIDGITTFQTGLPIYLNTAGNNLSKFFGAGTIRPNYTPGCIKTNGGSAYARSLATANSPATSKWFNTSCFTVPAAYAFGNEPRVDSDLRTAGIDNFDMAVQKATPVHEQISAVFRLEFYNIFNRVQFGYPVVQAGNSQFGLITYQANNPRLIQGALRINF